MYATQPHIYNGLYSDQLITGGSGGGIGSNGASSFTTTTISNATAYVLSFYAKISSSTFAATGFTLTMNDGTAHTCNPSGAGAPTINANGFQRVYCTVTSSSTTLSSISITANVSATFYIDAVQLETGTIPTAYQVGTIQLRGTINNPVSLEGLSNSTTAFQIQDSTGASNLFVADTLNGAISVNGSATIGGTSTAGTITLGQSTASNTISIGAAIGGSNTQTINIGNSATASSITTLTMGNTNSTSTTTIQHCFDSGGSQRLYWHCHHCHG
jgi:hypothetical protein